MAASHPTYPPRAVVEPHSLRPRRIGIMLTALLFVLCLGAFLLAALEVHAYQGAVARDDFTIAGQYPVPVTRFAPAGPPKQNVVAVVAHGYSGSKSVMSAIGVELARTGITTYTFDFPGHGSSQVPFAAGGHTDYNGAVASATPELDATVDEVVRYAVSHGPARGTQVILIGHSMGGAIMTDYALHAGASVPIAAVALFSPAWDSPPNVSPNVSSLPTLLVLAATNDIPGIRRQVEQVGQTTCGQALEAPGEETCTVGGKARTFRILPHLDHLSIVTAVPAITALTSFLRQDVTPTLPATQVRADDQLHWLLVGVLAALFATALLLPLLVALLRLPRPAATAATADLPNTTTKTLLIGEGVIIGATAAAVLIQQSVVPSPLAFLRQLTAPDVVTVMTIAGILWLALLVVVQPPAARKQVVHSLPTWPRQVLVGVLLFAALYVTMGMLATTAYVDVALTPARLWRFAVIALLLLPFFGASEWLHGAYAVKAPRLAVGFGVVAKVAMILALAGIVGSLLSFVIAIFFVFVGFEALTRRLVRSPVALVPVTEALVLACAIATVYPFVA